MLGGGEKTESLVYAELQRRGERMKARRKWGTVSLVRWKSSAHFFKRNFMIGKTNN